VRKALLLLNYLARSPKAVSLAELSRALGRYLSTAPINERTNDDKTLILASRR